MRVERINFTKKKADNDAPDLSALDDIIARHSGHKGNMIPLLQGAQELYGYIPKAAFEKLSRATGIPLSDMFGVATFYAQFRLNPVGKHIIKVCHGTACHVQNSVEITESLEEALKVRDGETTEDLLFTLESVACLGCCSLAPVMMISDQTYGKLTGNEAVRIIKNIRLGEDN